MNDRDERREVNDDYLRKALAWLELLLRRLAERKGVEGLPPPSPVLAELNGPDAPDDLDARVERLSDLTDELTGRLDLSPFEAEVLLLCVAIELEAVISDLCALVQPHEPRRNPTFALAMALFDDADSSAFAPGSPLRRWRLVEINQPGAQPLITSALRADERVVNFALGLEPLDDRLVAWVRRVDLPPHLQRLPHSQGLVLTAIRRQLQLAHRASAMPLIQLVGPDSMSKQAVAWRGAESVGYELDRIAAEDLPTHPSELETFGLLWRRECRLRRRALYLDADEVDPTRAGDGPAHPALRFIAATTGLVFLASREPWPRLGRTGLTLDVAKPTAAEQKALWSYALGDNPGDAPSALSGQFDLNTASIWAVVHSVRSEGEPEWRSTTDRLWDACRAASRARLDALAEHLSTTTTLRDLILPKDIKRKLRQVADQVGLRDVVFEDWGLARRMSRGIDLSVLFAGESGTGKTMAAEALANRLRLDLFRIDLSAVVSKYIGETEKNLRRVFDAAEGGGAILFFDEADALFGKRSEVKDSHDRYSNIEINYLLQRMESYRGLAILATNVRYPIAKARGL
jgi:hypothetical protein